MVDVNAGHSYVDGESSGSEQSIDVTLQFCIRNILEYGVQNGWF